jgi:hypothetical protein
VQASVSQTSLEIQVTSHKPVDFSGRSIAHRRKGHLRRQNHTATFAPQKPVNVYKNEKRGSLGPRRVSIADANAGELTYDHFGSLARRSHLRRTHMPVRSREVCSGEGMIRRPGQAFERTETNKKAKVPRLVLDAAPLVLSPRRFYLTFFFFLQHYFTFSVLLLLLVGYSTQGRYLQRASITCCSCCWYLASSAYRVRLVPMHHPTIASLRQLLPYSHPTLTPTLTLRCQCTGYSASSHFSLLHISFSLSSLLQHSK